MVRKLRTMIVVAGLLGLPALVFPASRAHAGSSRIVKIQAALDAWLADRRSPEKVTGVAAYISLGGTCPAIEAFAGKVGSAQDDPVRQGTLFQMGSSSKSFTEALILKLEAAGKLSIDEPLGKMAPAVSGVERCNDQAPFEVVREGRPHDYAADELAAGS